MSFDLERTVEVLERTPGALKALLSGLAETWLLSNEGEDSFSPRDVVGHMLHGEETDWIPRVEIILKEGTSRPFTPFDRFIFRETFKDLTMDELLEGFAAARKRNLERLASFELDDAALDREGQHPALGRVTLRQLLAAWTVHDLAHLRQIGRVMAKQYHEAVGPWERYFRVFNE